MKRRCKVERVRRATISQELYSEKMNESRVSVLIDFRYTSHQKRNEIEKIAEEFLDRVSDVFEDKEPVKE